MGNIIAFINLLLIQGTATYDILGIARWLPHGDYWDKVTIGCYEWHLNNRAIFKGNSFTDIWVRDFPGYFSIKANLTDENQWPLYEFSADIDRQNVSMNDALTNMSYVDNKNLAPYIKCPVYMFTGLQDAVCPPYTNFAVYNQITAPKHYTICPECEHNLGANTIEYVHNWFLSLMKD